MYFMSKNNFILSGFLLLNLLACSTSGTHHEDPVALFKEAEEEITNFHYQMAIEKLQLIKHQFPYSELAIDAQLRIADIYFLQESFLESATSYETFLDLHPKHPQAEYAMYRIGKSYFHDVPSVIMRDLTMAQKALSAYEKFLKRFPNATQREEATKDVLQVKQLLAEKEFLIAQFYWDQKSNPAAQMRFQKVIDLYPDTTWAQTAHKKIMEMNAIMQTHHPFTQKQEETHTHGHPSGHAITDNILD